MSNFQPDIQQKDAFGPRKNTVPISELPFSFDGIEEDYGPIKHAELVCPGVYYITTERFAKRPICGAEYIAVTDDCPAISPTARTYGKPLPINPKVLLYNCEDIFDKGWSIVRYEMHKYLADHDLPLSYNDLLDDEMFGMAICPEYFGEFSIPTETPWGKVLRSDKLWNGIYWLETEEAGWVLAIAEFYCDDLFEKTAQFASLLEYDRKHGIENTLRFRFYTYEMSCLPIYELVFDAGETWGDKINVAALKNAVVKFHPAYAENFVKENPNVPQEEMPYETPGAGTSFYRFPQ